MRAIGECGAGCGLLVTEAALPGLNGRTLVRLARDRIRDLPAVLVSAYDLPGLHRAGLQQLRKPFAPEAVTTAVRAAMFVPLDAAAPETAEARDG